jgi:hypothetical protein
LDPEISMDSILRRASRPQRWEPVEFIAALGAEMCGPKIAVDDDYDDFLWD